MAVSDCLFVPSRPALDVLLQLVPRRYLLIYFWLLKSNIQKELNLLRRKNTRTTATVYVLSLGVQGFLEGHIFTGCLSPLVPKPRLVMSLLSACQGMTLWRLLFFLRRKTSGILHQRFSVTKKSQQVENVFNSLNIIEHCWQLHNSIGLG